MENKKRFIFFVTAASFAIVIALAALVFVLSAIVNLSEQKKRQNSVGAMEQSVKSEKENDAEMAETAKTGKTEGEPMKEVEGDRDSGTQIKEEMHFAPEGEGEQSSQPRPRELFGSVTVTPEKILAGPGENIDAPEFWYDTNTEKLFLLVSAKKNEIIERWEFPFTGEASVPLELSTLPNGLAVDGDHVFVGLSEKEKIDLYTLPGFAKVRSFGKGKIGHGETNVDVLYLRDERQILYATDDETVYGFDVATGEQVYEINPDVEEIEEVLADSYYGVVYVAEEEGVVSKKYPGGAIEAYHPDGTPYARGGTHVFGRGVFDGDEEGMALYRCLADDKDTGDGFIVVSNQVPDVRNRFVFFDRRSWVHLGAVTLAGVTMTDGIASYEKALPDYPHGLFAAINNDADTAIVGWHTIFDATGLRCSEAETS